MGFKANIYGKNGFLISVEMGFEENLLVKPMKYKVHTVHTPSDNLNVRCSHIPSTVIRQNQRSLDRTLNPTYEQTQQFQLWMWNKEFCRMTSELSYGLVRSKVGAIRIYRYYHRNFHLAIRKRPKFVRIWGRADRSRGHNFYWSDLTRGRDFLAHNWVDNRVRITSDVMT
jgi:hypothetical protein